MTPAISFSNVSFYYMSGHTHPVLKDISFEVMQNEFIAIIGPNGGGKTTLLRLILGFLTPSSGKIALFGKKPEKSYKEIAYVPQSRPFDRQFPISVFELVLSGRLGSLPWHGRYSEEDKVAAKEALQKMNLLDFQDHSFNRLSCGQAQRALIARALMSKPKLLLLDEPTASVDSQAESDIYAILEELKEQVTIVMITHDLNTIIRKVGRVFCVQGNLEIQDPKDVCEHFALGLYHTSMYHQCKDDCKE